MEISLKTSIYKNELISFQPFIIAVQSIPNGNDETVQFRWTLMCPSISEYEKNLTWDIHFHDGHFQRNDLIWMIFVIESLFYKYFIKVKTILLCDNKVGTNDSV